MITNPTTIEIYLQYSDYMQNHCAVCGTEGKFPITESFDGRLCPECELEWEDFN